MHVIYSPIDPAHGDRQEWIFASGRVPASERELIEEHYDGKPWKQFVMEVSAGKAKAQRLLLWHLRRADQLASPHHRGPLANLRDVPDFCDDDLKILNSSSEIRDQMGRIEQSTGQLTEAEKRAALASGEVELAEALEREAGNRPPVSMPGDRPGAGAKLIEGGGITATPYLVDAARAVQKAAGLYAPVVPNGADMLADPPAEPARNVAAEAEQAARPPLSEPSDGPASATG